MLHGVVTPHCDCLEKLTHFVKVSSQSVKNWLRYWWKCAVLLETWGCYPSLRSSRNINPTLWRFRANPLRIDWDIDENVQFYSKHGVVTPHCDRLEILTLLCEGFRANPLRTDWDIDENVQFYSKHGVVTPHLRSSRKINPTLWRFRANPLRTDWDIDENVQFYSKHGVVTPHCDRLIKLTLLCEGFEPIR